MQSVAIGSLLIHLYGQNTFTQTGTITSNGNPITLSVLNSANYSVALTINNSSNTQVYNQPAIPNNNYPSSQTNTYTISLAAGTYSATLSINSNAVSGAQANFSQLAYVIQNDPVVIGGLRIKTITANDNVSTGTPMVTSYSYPSGGYLYSFPTYVQHIRNDLVATYGLWGLDSGFQKGLGFNSGCPLSGGDYFKNGGSLPPKAPPQGVHYRFPPVKISPTGNGYKPYKY